MQNTTKRLGIWALIVAGLISIPFVLTGLKIDGWQWTPSDGVFMFILLFGAGVVYEFVGRRMPSDMYRAGVGLAVVTSVVLVWINGAVGIIGDGPINMMYLAVPAIGFIGALLAWFRPRGMSYTLFVMALAQALVPVVALLIREEDFAPSVAGVFSLNAFFVLMYVGSALIFRRADDERDRLRTA